MGGEKAKAIKAPEKKAPAPPPPAKESAPLMLVLPSQGPAGGNAIASRAGTPIGYVPVEATLDPIVEGNEIIDAIESNDREKVLVVLQRNALPRDMYAMIRNFPGDMVRQLARMPHWSESQWRRAQAYLGDQVPLDLQIEKHSGDRDAVFADLQRIPDDQALDLVLEDSRLDWIVVKLPAEGEPIPPARASRKDVAEALHRALDPLAYFDAMRLLLSKAGRASKAMRAKQPEPMMGALQVGLPGVLPMSILELPALGDPSTVELVMVDAVQNARVELALEVIREADAKDWEKDKKARSRFYLALADLDALERRVAVPRLAENISKHSDETSTLEVLASNPDEATTLRNFVLNAAGRAGLFTEELDASALQVVLERSGKLLKDARASAEAAKPGTEDETKARAEVTRLEGAFIDWDMLTVLGREPASFEQRLKTLGATPLQVGTEMLRRTNSQDFTEIIATVKRIAPDVRVEAMAQSGMLDQLDWLDANQKELLGAYLTVSLEPSVHPTTTKLFDPPSSHALSYAYGREPDALPYVKRDTMTLFFDQTAPAADFRLLSHELYAARPRTTIAIAQILDDLANHKEAAALGLIRRLEENDRTEVYADPRVRDAIEHVSDSWIREALHYAWWNAQVELGVLAKRSGDSEAIFEAISARSGELGQADLRRGFVLAHRLAENPTLQLTEEERSQIRNYQATLTWGEKLSGWKNNETFKQLMLGQPKILGGQDPTAEAEFMRYRLFDRAGVRDPMAFGQWVEDKFESSGPRVDEALARFETYYRQVRDGGVTVSELAQLGELYHDAMRAMDKFLADNESFAHRMARIVGGIVAAVIVIALTMGGATPFVIAAVAALGAGAAEAATGAVIRTENHFDQVALDFLAGTVEGLAMAAGNALGASAVEGLGLVGGELAVQAGGQAMRQVSRGFFASLVENAIAGAVGGAASEVFETATDRATWDRGIAEAFTKILAAAARGAAFGAVTAVGVTAVFHGAGKIIAAIARKEGPAVAKGVNEMLEASGVEASTLEKLGAGAEDDLARAWEHVQAQRYADAEKILEELKIPRKAISAMLEVGRVRYAIRVAGELGGLPEGAAIKPTVLNADEFAAKVGKQRGDAAVIIRDGKPEIIVKLGAPASVIREEMVHVVQFYTDPLMRARMLLLSEENIAAWATKSAAERAEMYVAKLEVEADAQRRILAMLEEDVVAGDREAAIRALDAQETLGNLNEKLGAARLARAGGVLESVAPDAAPTLFAKGAQTPRISKTAGADVKRLVTKGKGLNVNNAKDLQRLEKEFGYIPGEDSNGRIFRLSRTTEATEKMPHLQVEADGKVVIGERPSFAEQRMDAAEQWRALNDLPRRLKSAVPEVVQVAKAEQAELAKGFYKQLAKKVANNELDEASAGLLMKWGKVIEDVDKKVGGAAGKRVMSEMLESIPKGTKGALSQTEVDAFRRTVRTRVVTYLKSIRDGEERMTRMHELFTLMDPSSQGALFTEYRRAVMPGLKDRPGGAALFGAREEVDIFKFRSGVTRTPDDAVTLLTDVTSEDGRIVLRKGRYAIEDKAGENAFRLDQAQDYARGVSRSSSDYDGILYIFSDFEHAGAALQQLQVDKITKGLVGRAQGGIHVSYFDPDGVWRVL